MVKSISQSRDTLDHTVYLRVKDIILKQELAPGELIVQSKLSEKLGVSRTPLRKALGELEKEGFLESTVKGWYVKELTIDALISIFQIRSVLEGLASRIATSKIRKPDIAYLRAIFTEAYEKSSEEQAEAYYQADMEFHNRIVSIADDYWLEKQINATQIIRTTMSQGLYRSPKETYPEHMAILDAMEDRDEILAETLTREHTNNTVQVIKKGDFNIYK